MMAQETSSTSCEAIDCTEITDYLEIVEQGKVRTCERQKKLCRYIRKTFDEEELFIDKERLEKYEKLIRFFPFKRLFPWELFLIALFLCTFTAEGLPRWNKLICFIGRGAGKTGFIAFLAFCVLTAINGIANYNVDVIANTEPQARLSFKAVLAVLERNAKEFRKKVFDWNKKVITSLSTFSEMAAWSSNSGGLDGLASGLFICDEVHYMETYENITTLKTGQGKCEHPRRAYISSNGNKRDGVFDRELARCDKILDGATVDNGYLPFVCLLEDADEVHDPKNWEKANPSLPYDETLFRQTMDDYNDWLEDPASNPDFMTKRMGIPVGDVEHQVAPWELLVDASRELPDLAGRPCVLGIDFANKNDFLSAVLLFRDENQYYALHHSWFCLRSRFRSRIKAPIEEWADMGLLTLVDDVEIPTSMLMDWIHEMRRAYDVRGVALDDYRYDIIRKGLEDEGFSVDAKTVEKVRPSHHMRVQPIINSALVTKTIAWGDDPMMRWCTNNTKLVPFANGNYKYEKIEPKGRKTDAFMALVAAFCIEDMIPDRSDLVFLPPLRF